MSILEGELAAEVAERLEAADVLTDVTVTRMIPGGGPAHDPDPPTPDPHACKGFLDAYTADERAGTVIAAEDVRIFVVPSSIDITPDATMTVTIDGTTYTIVRMSLDPANALYDLQART